MRRPVRLWRHLSRRLPSRCRRRSTISRLCNSELLRRMPSAATNSSALTIFSSPAAELCRCRLAGRHRPIPVQSGNSTLLTVSVNPANQSGQHRHHRDRQSVIYRRFGGPNVSTMTAPTATDIAGDNIFSYLADIPARHVERQPDNLTYHVTDAQMRSASTTYFIYRYAAANAAGTSD